MRIKVTILSLFALTLLACQSADMSSIQSSSTSSSSQETSSASVPTFFFDELISYGSDERQVMEIAYNFNANEPMYPVLMIHGGSWIGGDKSLMRRYRQRIMDAGYVYISMNYRFISSGATYLDMLADIHLAIRFLSRQANHYRINSNKMAILGESAGAHLGLLYGYTMTSPIPIEFITALVPPLDFTDPGYLMMQEPALQLLLANALMNTTIANPEELASTGYPDAWFDASPITHLNNALPTLIAYATKDELIPLSNNLRFLEAALALSAPVEMIEFPNSGHDLQGDPDVLTVFTETFQEYLQNYLT